MRLSKDMIETPTGDHTFYAISDCCLLLNFLLYKSTVKPHVFCSKFYLGDSPTVLYVVVIHCHRNTVIHVMNIPHVFICSTFDTFGFVPLWGMNSITINILKYVFW